jgi:hypothetical protein
MSVITLLDNPSAKLMYHPEEQIVHHQFHKGLDSETLRLVLNTGIDLLREHRAVKWLSDNRAIGPHEEDDRKWINEVWLPKVLTAGWKYWALIVPDDVKGRQDMSSYIQLFYENGVRVMVFTDVQAAKKWLISVN